MRSAVQAAVDAGDLSVAVPAEVAVERPRVKEHGDYATSIALQLAKPAGLPPRHVAELLAARLREVDATLMRLNIALLMLVSFLPFPTQLVADALTESEAAERAAVVVYGAVALSIELVLATMARHVASQPSLAGDGEEIRAPGARKPTCASRPSRAAGSMRRRLSA